jgi:hypothetical protein
VFDAGMGREKLTKKDRSVRYFVAEEKADPGVSNLRDAVRSNVYTGAN